MKKIKLVAVILLAAMLMNLLASCEGFDLNGILNFGDSESGDSLNLTSGYTIAYSRASESDVRMEAMLKEGFAKFGGKVDSNPNKLKSFDKEIILGGVTSKEETKDLVNSLKADTNDMLGAYVVRAIGKKVFVYASCPEAERLAIDALFSYVENGKLLIPADLDLTVYFNLYEYKNSGELFILPNGLSDIIEPARMTIDGMTVVLESGKYEYNMIADPTVALPAEDKIEVLLYSDKMSYDISYSSDAITVKIDSEDGEKSQEYRFLYSFDDEYTVLGVVVNKDGAKGALSLVSDDGDPSTAQFFRDVVAPQYDSFKVSIAVITRDIATLQSSADGKTWLKDEDGNYILNIDQSKLDFWKNILECDQIELISHTHTHASCGTSDEAPANGKYPAGNVIKEIHASAQILRDLLGQDSPFIARAGGAFWPNNDEFRQYFYDLISSDPTFLGMRTSNGDPPLPGASGTKLNSHERFANAKDRLEIATILVKGTRASFNEDGTEFPYANGGKLKDILNAGVGAWTNYIDLAIENGQWASIGFHDVVSETGMTHMPDGYSVTQPQVLALMDYVQPLVDSGDLWVGTFSEIAEYYFQWSTSEVSAKAYGDERIEVTLTDKEEDSRMDSALTVKINVPRSWTAAELDSYGVKTTLEVHVDEDGSYFVYANIVPGEEVSVITPVK